MFLSIFPPRIRAKYTADIVQIETARKINSSLTGVITGFSRCIASSSETSLREVVPGWSEMMNCLNEFKARCAMVVAIWLACNPCCFASDDSTLIIQIHDRVAVIANQEYPIDDAKALVVAIKQQRQTNKDLTKVSVQPSLDTKHTDVVKLMDAIHECSFRKVKFLEAK